MNTLLFIIFLLSLPVIAFFTIRTILALIKKDNAGVTKQLKFSIVSGVVMIVSLIAFVATADPIDEANEVAVEDIAEKPGVKVEQVDEEPKKEEVSPVEVEKPKEVPVVKQDPAEESVWDDMKDKDKIVGNSDENFKEITKSKPGKVRNDKTGNWKKVTIAENVDIEDYLLSYADHYMDDGEVHYIINFNYNTTTVVNKMGGLLYADIKEYVNKEEHDAVKIGSGMELKSYIIYPDGDIEEVK